MNIPEYLGVDPQVVNCKCEISLQSHVLPYNIPVRFSSNYIRYPCLF